MSSERKEGGSGDIFQLVKGLPTNPDRRIRQCVQLAQRLLVTEEQRENAKKKSLALEAAAISMKKQLEAVTADLSRTAQPTAYLVARLRDEEDAKKATDSRCQVR
jgi:predicted transcriptional regulator